MRVVFMGSPEFSVPSLEALMESPHEIAAVYSQPPRKAGRGKSLRVTPVHDLAQKAGLLIRNPLNFSDFSDIEAFRTLEADIAIVIAYGLLLPQSVLDAPRLGCVNLHASLLPRWRGAAPIHRAIMAGDRETGVCLMQMDAGLDTGDVLAKVSTPIDPMTTTGDLHDQLAELSAQLLLANLDNIENLSPKPQSEDGVEYAAKISKDEAKINWNFSARALQCHIHGLSPFPGAWSTLSGERIKFHRVEVVDIRGEPGQIADDQLTITCGDGALRPKEIQRAGKRAMPIAEALNGLDFAIGQKLEE